MIHHCFLCVLVCLAGGACLVGAETDAVQFTDEQRSHWAFQEVRETEIPTTEEQQWTRNPIDAFVLKKLEDESIVPSGEADAITLIRRARIDLTGLPPSTDEIAEFLADDSCDAYERYIDRLLASPEYGERWGRHWLDLAMFAESTGFETDETRPNAWRYRDYVIDAFNSDKPYDQFLTEQIAGDELWPDKLEARLATAFMRHYPEEGNNKDILLARQEILHHVTDLVGSTFMGLTFNCAQCHDHKHDPILQRDYYRLQAFFANIGHDDHIPLVTKIELRKYEEQLAAYESRTDALWQDMDDLLATVRKYSPKQLLARYPDYVIEAMSAAANERTPLQSQIAYILNNKDCGTCPQRPEPHADSMFAKDAKSLKGDAQNRFAKLKSELDRWQEWKPRDLPRGMGIVDISDTAPSTSVLGVGLHTSPKEEVQPVVLSILDPKPIAYAKPDGLASTGRRTALARWLTSASNPLTARVMINRIWHYHFGRGIVGTPSDFGFLGDSPSHPELLDWLASRFVENGWNCKSIHRLILTSATYRQSSLDRPDAITDRDNRLLWRFSPQRLDAESIRDAALAISGMLHRRVGGPSVFPPLPNGKATPVGGWTVSKNPADHSRRSVYIFVRRNDRYPMLEAFDFPDSHEACACRNQTLTASQALMMLNSQVATELANAFAKHVHRQAGSMRANQVEYACRSAWSRSPDEQELNMAINFLERQTQIIATERGLAQATNTDSARVTTKQEDSPEQQSLADYCLMLLNSNEFLFRF